MDPNEYKTVESFVKSFEKVYEIIKEKDPDCIIAPIFGAVPFIDVLNVVDEQFANNKVEYVPASNRVYRLRDVLRGAFENIIDEYAPDGGSFLSIDEVISGNSVQRVYKQFDAARTNYANKKTVQTYGENANFEDENVSRFRDSVKESIKYNSIGIVDSKMDRLGKRKEPCYYELLEEKVIIPVNTDCIVTMDRTDFFPAKYKLDKDSEGKSVCLPVIEKFDISAVYIDFLQKVAGILGKDPAKVTVSNIGKIRDSYKWVPENLRNI